MTTIRQRKLAQAIIENSTREKPLTKKELVVSSGYAEMSAESSSGFLIDQQGVKDALNEYGFTEDNAKRVVAEILLNEDESGKNRLKASELVFKVHGTFAPEKSLTVTMNGTIENEDEGTSLAEEYEEKLRNKMLDGNITGTGIDTRVAPTAQDKE